MSEHRTVTITAHGADRFDIESGLAHSRNVRRSVILAHTKVTAEQLDIANALPLRAHTFAI